MPDTIWYGEYGSPPNFPGGGGTGGTPDPHAPSHSAGATDPVTVTNLAGYPGGTANFLRADGTFAAPPGGTVPGAHATSHQPGGGDPMAVDAAAATGSLRTLGTSATAACAGNDSRLTNARTPTTHATTHSAAQPDAITVTNLAGYPGGTANFLRADGTFAAPPTGGIPAAHATTHQPGGADPMAVDAVAGTGSLRTLGTSGTSACAGNDSRLTNSRTPTTHATSHQPGGGDAMAVDAVAATGSLRTLGTSATSACAGNDARLSDTRTPALHATSHKSGGTDKIKLDELDAPTDITTLNASTGAHGLLRKLSGTATQYLDGSGNWTTPATGTPGLHAVTHKSGGTDVVKLDELGAPTDITTLNASTSAHGLLVKLSGTTTHYLRGDGTFVTPPAVAPAAHATTHNTGGSDPITALAGTVITTGTVADARLSSNVALKDGANTWTAKQTFTLTGTATEINAASPILAIHQSTGTANQRRFHIGLAGDTLSIDPKTDAGGGTGANGLFITRLGDIKAGGNVYEQGRGAPMGHWLAVTYNAGHYTAGGGMVWAVEPGDVIWNRYMLIGKTLCWMVSIQTSSLGTAIGNELFVTVPASLTVRGGVGMSQLYDNAENEGQLYTDAAGSTFVTIIKKPYATFTPNTSLTYLSFQGMFEVL